MFYRGFHYEPLMGQRWMGRPAFAMWVILARVVGGSSERIAVRSSCLWLAVVTKGNALCENKKETKTNGSFNVPNFSLFCLTTLHTLSSWFVGHFFLSSRGELSVYLILWAKSLSPSLLLLHFPCMFVLESHLAIFASSVCFYDSWLVFVCVNRKEKRR